MEVNAILASDALLQLGKSVTHSHTEKMNEENCMKYFEIHCKLLTFLFLKFSLQKCQIHKLNEKNENV